MKNLSSSAQSASSAVSHTLYTYTLLLKPREKGTFLTSPQRMKKTINIKFKKVSWTLFDKVACSQMQKAYKMLGLFRDNAFLF